MVKNKFVYAVASTSVFLLLVGCSSNVSKIPEEETKHVEEKNEDSKVASAKHEVHWSYEGETGAEHWGELDPANSVCANGTEQSPVDIELTKLKIDKNLQDIQINYKPTAFTMMNNGHTIQANDTSSSNSIVIEGKQYKLIQVHFHKPSENQIDGKSFDMEGHLVHKNDEGQLAVLGFLISDGKENEALAELFSKLPKEETKQDIALDNPIEMSKEQTAAFGAIFPNNSRPFHPMNDREILTK